jgi:energy-coupling factor transport system substrate-specific component
MSWQASVMVLLGAVLAGGFLWYERSRPPSQIVALVAALAALAVAGRIAFSPIPNVVPTTDIALLSGYALGGGPGFAVGALAALVSNFWLGQGPWTPWQMAGWGMTGLLGAWLAAASGRGLGRVALAVVCAAAGFAYGALLDLSLMVTYGGEQSLDRFLALSARGLPFNVAHAAGNAALALVAGPALVRMLLRHRRRFEFAWSRGGGTTAPAPGRRAAAGAACVIACLTIAAPALLAPEPAGAAGPDKAVSWLKRAQNPDGGFGPDPGTPSSPVMTGWACLGLEAAGRNPLDLRKKGRSPIDYLEKTVSEIRSAGDLERTILVLEGAGLDSRRFASRDLVARLRARRKGDGSWPGEVNPTAFGILALTAAGSRNGISRSAAWLRSARNADGGWGFARGSASDPDSTGAALQALAAAGGSRDVIAAGANWLRGAQVPGGGFAVTGGPPNAQSTAWAVQGLLAAGVAPASLGAGGRSPLDYLRSVQARDGHYRYSSVTDQTKVWVTGQALAAVSQKPFPLGSAPRTAGKEKPGGKDSSAGAPGLEDSGPTAPGPPGGSGSPGAAPAPSSGAGSAPAQPAAPPTPTVASVSPEPAASSAEDEDDGPPPWLLPAGVALLLLLGAGGWALRQGRLR